MDIPKGFGAAVGSVNGEGAARLPVSWWRTIAAGSLLALFLFGCGGQDAVVPTSPVAPSPTPIPPTTPTQGKTSRPYRPSFFRRYG